MACPDGIDKPLNVHVRVTSDLPDGCNSAEDHKAFLGASFKNIEATCMFHEADLHIGQEQVGDDLVVLFALSSIDFEGLGSLDNKVSQLRIELYSCIGIDEASLPSQSATVSMPYLERASMLLRAPGERHACE